MKSLQSFYLGAVNARDGRNDLFCAYGKDKRIWLKAFDQFCSCGCVQTYINAGSLHTVCLLNRVVVQIFFERYILLAQELTAETIIFFNENYFMTSVFCR